MYRQPMSGLDAVCVRRSLSDRCHRALISAKALLACSVGLHGPAADRALVAGGLCGAVDVFGKAAGRAHPGNVAGEADGTCVRVVTDEC